MRPLRHWRALAGAAFLAAACAVAPVRAGSVLGATCETQEQPDAARVALALRVAAAVQQELARLDAPVAIVARAGLDLRVFSQRYSHAGLSLRDHTHGPWTVRQLYFACEEGRPRIFDQGLAAFVLGNDARVRVQLVAILPGPRSASVLAQAAGDGTLALRLLGASYSANAHAFSDLHQNCNQWVAELMAVAWGELRHDAPGLRQRAQAWLRANAFDPTVLNLAWPPLRPLRALVPWVREDDHPEQDLRAWRYRVVMPDSLERFVRRMQPDASRLEFCLDDARRLVVRTGWEPLEEACVAGVGDRVLELPPLLQP